MIDHSVKERFLTNARSAINLPKKQKEKIMLFMAEEWDNAFNAGILIGLKNAGAEVLPLSG